MANPSPPKEHQFTSETAKIAAAKSAESRRQNPLRRVPPGFRVVPASDAQMPQYVSADDGYSGERLCRVRNQLDLIDCRIREEAAKARPDGQLLNWLASAQSRLAEQERQLAGRPLPGSLRPSSKPSKGRPAPLPEAGFSPDGE